MSGVPGVDFEKDTGFDAFLEENVKCKNCIFWKEFMGKKMCFYDAEGPMEPFEVDAENRCEGHYFKDPKLNAELERVTDLWYETNKRWIIPKELWEENGLNDAI